MTPESKVANYLKKRCREHGIYIRKICFEGRAAAPDYMIICPYAVLFVETKAPGMRPRPAQSREFALIEAAGGGPVIVLDSTESVDHFINIIVSNNRIKSILHGIHETNI